MASAGTGKRLMQVVALPPLPDAEWPAEPLIGSYAHAYRHRP